MTFKKKDRKTAQSGATEEVTSALGTSSRRGFLRSGAGLVAGAAASQLLPTSSVTAQQNGANAGMAQALRAANTSGRPILLKDGMVLSMDPQVGDFQKADILIQGKKIMSVGPNAEAPKSALVVNAAGMIVMPGFIDTHHHQYETLLRAEVADSIVPVAVEAPPKNNYTSVIGGIFTPFYTPDDARLAELLASVSQLAAGVITTVDTSQVQLSPEHTDACLEGLKQSGRRCQFNYGASGKDAATRTPMELMRLKKQYFASNDQLLTLSSGGAGGPDGWKYVRSLGIPIVTHIVGDNTMGTLQRYADAGVMGPDCEYIHCTRLSETMWKKIADTGGKVSIAAAIEMQMQHGLPPFQQAIDHGIRPSLSVDVECNMTADLFTVMRAAYLCQRALANERIIVAEKNAPRLLTCREAIEFGTIAGAKATHLDAKIGSLTPGKEADIIMLATDKINVMVTNNVPGVVVTLMDTSNVEHVFVAGKVMKWQGTMVGLDLNKLRQDCNRAVDGLFERSKFPRDLFGSCCITT